MSLKNESSFSCSFISEPRRNTAQLCYNSTGSTTQDLVLQGYLAHETPPPRRTLQNPDAQGPMVILGGWGFLMREVPLYSESWQRGAGVCWERGSGFFDRDAQVNLSFLKSDEFIFIELESGEYIFIESGESHFIDLELMTSDRKLKSFREGTKRRICGPSKTGRYTIKPVMLGRYLGGLGVGI